MQINRIVVSGVPFRGLLGAIAATSGVVDIVNLKPHENWRSSLHNT